MCFIWPAVHFIARFFLLLLTLTTLSLNFVLAQSKLSEDRYLLKISRPKVLNLLRKGKVAVLQEFPAYSEKNLNIRLLEKEILRSLRLRQQNFFSELGTISINMGTTSLTRLERDKSIIHNWLEYFEPNSTIERYLALNDPYFDAGQQWALHNKTLDIDTNAAEAWDYFSKFRSTETVVAVIDTGVDYKHEDLRANLWKNKDDIPLNNIDEDRNGIIDDYHGYNPVDKLIPLSNSIYELKEGDPFDSDFHGTHVAGIIAAKANNSLGISGIAGPFDKIKIMPIRMFNILGQSNLEVSLAAYNYVIAMKKAGNNIRVVNASWGFANMKNEPLALRDAIRQAEQVGIITVAAAGNGGSDRIADDNDLVPTYPANCNVESLLSVSAIDQNGNMGRGAASGLQFANYGLRNVDLAAPGVNILSTLAIIPPNTSSNTLAYGALDGTSMAAPHVSGAAALIFALRPDLTPKNVANTIVNSVKKLSSLNGRVRSGGTLDLLKSLQSVFQPPASGSAWQNKVNPLDVNNDGYVSPLDSLLVLNFINSNGAGPVPDAIGPNQSGEHYIDVNGDNNVSPIDSLLVLNKLNGL